ncbi:MAG: rhomboid family intramembrane serine protease [Candidatus Obscuribacterales bacterium]|nr:rhomboid family intramembrane serine protease [Steroidobacteraceae bacterium]
MFQHVAPVTRTLILINVAAYFLSMVPDDLSVVYYLALWPWHTSGMPGVPPFEVWQLVTYGFLHDTASFTHIFFNMFALYMFGSDVERSMGTSKYLSYYFVCVIGAAIAQTLVMAWANSPPIPTVGASGGVFGLLLAFGIAFPHRRLMLLFPPIPMPAWLFVTLYGVIELALGIFGTQQGVAHFAHLGGMAAGYVLIRYWRRGRR